MGFLKRQRDTAANKHGSGKREVERRLPSTQECVVALSDVRRDVLCLRTEATRTKRRRRQNDGSDAATPANNAQDNTLYRAVLATTSVNFTLKAAAEQEALLAGYRAFLNGLAFPVQILIRVRPLDLGPYLAQLAPDDRGGRKSAGDTRLQSLGEQAGGEQAGGEQAGQQHVARDRMASDVSHHATVRRLAADHAVFVRHLARRHTLLERHFYVVIPAEVAPHAAKGTGPFSTDSSSSGSPISGAFLGLLRGLLPGARRARTAATARAYFDAIAQRLDLRAGEVVRHLARFGVEARRLEGDQLVALYYQCLSPQAALHPLPAMVSAATLLPVQSVTRADENVAVLDGVGCDESDEAASALGAGAAAGAAAPVEGRRG